METETAQSVDRLEISLPEKSHELRLWLIDQVVILGEAYAEELTDARLRVYAADLADLNRMQLEIAFAQARRELKFFPKIAELRELAGAKVADAQKVEAEAAWKFAGDYLRKWGVDLLPLYSGGNIIEAPALPARIEYAMRRIGGLRGLNGVTDESRPFMFKDFVEAYNLAPMAESLAPQLAETFCDRKLLGKARQLTGLRPFPKRLSTNKAAQPPTFRAKSIPAPLTDAQIRDRREILHQQEAWLRRAGTSKTTDAVL